MPAEAIASKSAFMPSFETFPPMKWNQVSGKYTLSGDLKRTASWSLNAALASAAGGRAGVWEESGCAALRPSVKHWLDSIGNAAMKINRGRLMITKKYRLWYRKVKIILINIKTLSLYLKYFRTSLQSGIFIQATATAVASGT
jgi:hypothetical protein